MILDDSGKAIGVGIIDGFTGRVLDGRRWSDGLHQSIETKEGIAVSEQSQVIAKVTYQVRAVSSVVFIPPNFYDLVPRSNGL